MDIPTIKTRRLDLVSLSLPVLTALHDGGPRLAQDRVDFRIPEDTIIDNRDWLRRRIERIVDDPDQHPWMYRAIVRRADQQMVGTISFHHRPPDPELSKYGPLAAELGYAIETPFRRQGYARESALAMFKWAYMTAGVLHFILSIEPANLASVGLAKALNFSKAESMSDKNGRSIDLMYARINKIPI